MTDDMDWCGIVEAWKRKAERAEAERDALKALLAEADAALADVPEWQSIEALRDRIDAALREKP